MTPEAAGPEEWAERFGAQAAACDDLGSPTWARLLRLLDDDCRAAGRTWELVAPHAGLRFGQAGPLRLLGAAHRLALSGDAPDWAAVLPSCGGSVPRHDADLWAAWDSLVDDHAAALSAGLEREVQTNEVGRAAGLALGLAATGFPTTRLVELGCSGGLNLRLDRFRIDLGGVVLGDPDGSVRIAPEWTGPLDPSARLPRVVARTGLDPHPIDATSPDGASTLLGFVWPDQLERMERVRAAIDVARSHPAELRAVTDTAAALVELLADPPAPADTTGAGDTAGRSDTIGTVVQHSIVWQYLPPASRWAVTAGIEAAGERAGVDRPLAWLRYEPDEWDRTRAAVWLRTWPGGADRLVAHVDFHGRWIRSVPGTDPLRGD